MRERGVKGKVLFIVSTQQLARQQNTKLKGYISGIKVVDITGDSDSPIHSTLSQVDIIVCTAGKLCGELCHDLIHMYEVTLLVLDECHHTRGRDSYAEVMEHYLTDKRNGRRLPHVIGMTASPGAGHGRSLLKVKVIDHQVRLCARIDATHGIKCVEENITELNRILPTPSFRSHSLPPRSRNDDFIQVISKAMDDLEQKLPDKTICAFDRFTFAYQQWIKSEIEAAQLSEMDSQRDQINILEFLEVYHLSLITYEDFEIENARDILYKVKLFDGSVMNDMERHLNKVHNQVLVDVDGIKGSPNALLDESKVLLVNHFRTKPASKALFFVRSVDHTQYVTDWIKRIAELSELVRPCSITGHGSMSKAEQLKIIDDFRNGEYNLLAATSVLEEGLDVPECNMVIRFQIMSDEIADVQAQGRARDENSTLHTIVTTDSPVHHRLLINNDKKEQAKLAAEHISLVGVDLAKIAVIQKEILELREKRIREAHERKQTWRAEDVELHCSKCASYACNAAELCRFDNGSVVVPFEAFVSTKMKKVKRAGPKPRAIGEYSRPYKIACKNCNEEWGVWGVWKSYSYPVLQCKKFTFYNKANSEHQKSKQWKLVPFEITFFTNFEDN